MPASGGLLLCHPVLVLRPVEPIPDERPDRDPRDLEHVAPEVHHSWLMLRIRALRAQLDMVLVHPHIAFLGHFVLKAGHDHLAVLCGGLGPDRDHRSGHEAEPIHGIPFDPEEEVGLSPEAFRHRPGDPVPHPCVRQDGLARGERLIYTRPGVTVEGVVRALVAHEASSYEEWGASGAIRIDPGASGRGLSFTLTPAWGNAGSAAERLWGLGDARGLAPDGEFEAGSRLDAELGYGLRASPGVVTPFAGLGVADGGARTLRLGARWTLGPATSLNLEGARSEAANDNADQRIGLTFSMRW